MSPSWSLWNCVLASNFWLGSEDLYVSWKVPNTFYYWQSIAFYVVPWKILLLNLLKVILILHESIYITHKNVLCFVFSFIFNYGRYIVNTQARMHTLKSKHCIFFLICLFCIFVWFKNNSTMLHYLIWFLSYHIRELGLTFQQCRLDQAVVRKIEKRDQFVLCT